MEGPLVYAGRDRLGITRQQLGENVRKLINEGSPSPWDPAKGHTRPRLVRRILQAASEGNATYPLHFQSQPRVGGRLHPPG